MSRRVQDITPDLVLRAYRAGLFPMAEDRDSPVLHWLDPPRRGVLPLDHFHLSRRLFRSIRSGQFAVAADSDFAATLTACAAPLPGRPQTWINGQIETVFNLLHRAGYAHSVECRRDGQLVGGLYGVALGAAFFGESMFSTERDASKVALVHLVARLRLGGFVLLDTQFVTAHLTQFGAVEVPRAYYKTLLAQALGRPARFPAGADAGAIEAEIAAMADRSTLSPAAPR
jgi:leucyl/phenylalanyl-tRNA--protein transferase